MNVAIPRRAGLKTLLDEKDEDRARDLSELLFETSLLTSGFQVGPDSRHCGLGILVHICVGRAHFPYVLYRLTLPGITLPRSSH